MSAWQWILYWTFLVSMGILLTTLVTGIIISFILKIKKKTVKKVWLRVGRFLLISLGMATVSLAAFFIYAKLYPCYDIIRTPININIDVLP